MSTSKTVFPGVDNNYDAQSSDAQRAYSNNYDGNNGRCGTFFPGMHGVKPMSTEPRGHEGAHKVSRKPLVGFLYSISRTEIGEYWPLYIGQNTIGSSSKNDVYLKEATVSQDHALIVIRKMKNPEKVIASISDARSTNGTMINGVSLGFAAEECKNGDVLTFGENYQCMLILIDTKEVGLSLSDSFISVQDEEIECVDAPSFNSATRISAFRDYGANSTVGAEGDAPIYNGGGTVGM